jgi:hopene-associated glycosyltransferase HpnB
MGGVPIARAVAASSLAGWVYLALGHGRFWLTSVRLPPVGAGPSPATWPDVVAVVPARDEATVLPETLPALLGQDYPGRFRVVVVDDASADETAAQARTAGAQVVSGGGPPPGWTGKVAAMAAGFAAAAQPDYVLFTDADIRYLPGALTALVRAAVEHDLDLVSQMVRLRTDTGWERLIVPAFVYFFAQLYPFRRINRPRSHTAAAAGGCMLIRRSALIDAGGLARVADALIDDVAVARLIKHRPGGGRIWLGLTEDLTSVRPYPRLADLWAMVSRSAYTQLRHSPWLLAATVLGLVGLYLVPPIAALSGLVVGDGVLAALGAMAWAIMAGTFGPMLRLYRLPARRALALPGVAAVYLAMTVDSARQHARGRGGTWKGRPAPARAKRLADPR